MLGAMKPVRIPIEDVIDLHTFRPQDLAPLIEDYIDACLQAGFSSVRIIHGKGRGIQKQRVRELLRRSPHVVSFQDAPPEAGGWGATMVALSRIRTP
jgi:DNA-nicking Smr family endonuclease